MQLRRGSIIQALVEPLLVVELEVRPQPGLQVSHRPVLYQIEVLILHTPPEPLHGDVIQSPPPTTHANPYPSILQDTGELL